MKKLKFPVVVTECGVTAKIRKATQTKNGEIYALFIVEYWLLGKRKREARANFDEARDVAVNACRQIANGNQAQLTLTNDDRLKYLRALDYLNGTGIDLDVAARDYAAAVKELPSGATLKDAVEFYRRRNAAALETRTVRQVADEMIAAKRSAKLSDVHIDDLEYRLGRFAGDFQMNISSVSRKMIQEWLDGLNASGRTKQNYLRHIAALVRFAIKRKYLPKDAIDEIEAVETPKQDAGEIEILTPDEMREVLSAARPEMIPWLAIAGFAGLRSAELARLDWSEINSAEQFIEIKASKAKTAARRLVPITDNLAQWLAHHAKESGIVVTFKSWWNQIPKIADAVNAARERTALEAGKDPATMKRFVWRHNALRHSFCSYRLAAIKNAAQVALEAGNSPQMIFKHYRQVVTESEAAKWFAVAPLANSQHVGNLSNRNSLRQAYLPESAPATALAA
jgi:integrase